MRHCFLMAAFAMAPLGSCWSADLLGLYVGASAGAAQLRATDKLPEGYPGTFSKAATAFKITAGIRPLPFLGAEVSYDDFGSAQGHYNYSGPIFANEEGRVSMRGETAYGVLYLPLHHFDLFAKAGVAAIRSDSRDNGLLAPRCAPGEGCPAWVGVLSSRIVETNTNFAAGAGAQVKFSSWAIRAEYERFTAAGAHPSLIAAGFIWAF